MTNNTEAEGFVTIPVRTLDKLTKDIQLLEEKLEFEKYELEQWKALAKGITKGNPLKAVHAGVQMSDEGVIG